MRREHAQHCPAFRGGGFIAGRLDVFHVQLMHRLSISELDGSFNTIHYTRGNITKTTAAVSFDGSGNVSGSISGYMQYDIAGYVVNAIDPRSTTSNIIAGTFDFSDRFGAPDGEARQYAAWAARQSDHLRVPDTGYQCNWPHGLCSI